MPSCAWATVRESADTTVDMITSLFHIIDNCSFNLARRTTEDRLQERLMIVRHSSVLPRPSFPSLRQIRDRLNLGCTYRRRIRTGFNADLADIHDLGQALKALEILSNLAVTAF